MKFQWTEREPHPSEQGTKMVLKPEESPQWAKESILARRVTTIWLVKRPVRCPDFEDKSLQKVDGLVEIPYISDEHADENPEVRVSMKGV